MYSTGMISKAIAAKGNISNNFLMALIIGTTWSDVSFIFFSELFTAGRFFYFIAGLCAFLITPARLLFNKYSM
ncbi:hypothetical protein HA42_09890 [Pantoea deleyi]|nr:hypothetical protein HA42_09890 [Pantoea deleyi]